MRVKPMPIAIPKSLASRMIVGATLLFGVTVGLVQALTWPIWFDEAFTLHAVSMSWRDMFGLLATDIHPPLYYMVVKIWASLAGDSLSTVRLLSVAFIAMGMTLHYFTTKELFGRRAALMSLALVAIAPMLVRYAPEARMYALVYMLATASTYILIRPRTQHRWLWFGALTGLGVMTHYMYALIPMAQALWWVTSRTMSNRAWRNAALSAGIAGLAFLPWSTIAVSHFVDKQHGFWLVPVSWETMVSFVGTLWFYRLAPELSFVGTLAALLLSAGVVWLVCVVWRQSTLHARRSIALYALLATLPPIVVGAVSLLAQPMYLERYFLTSFIWAISLAGVVAALAMRQAKRRSWLLYGAFVIALSVGTTHVMSVGNYIKTEQRTPNTQLLVDHALRMHDAPLIVLTQELYVHVRYAAPEHAVVEHMTLFPSRETAEIKAPEHHDKRVKNAWIVAPTPFGVTARDVGASRLSDCFGAMNDHQYAAFVFCYAT